MIRWCTVPEIWCTTDKWTNRWADRKSDIEVGAPPKNKFHILNLRHDNNIYIAMIS